MVDTELYARFFYRRSHRVDVVWDRVSSLGLSLPLILVPRLAAAATSRLLLERIEQFRGAAPCADWNGVWLLVEK
jgi:hypothetical protein